MEIEPVWNSKVGSHPGVRGGRSVEKLRLIKLTRSVFHIFRDAGSVLVKCRCFYAMVFGSLNQKSDGILVIKC
jgi:hypothetical protein